MADSDQYREPAVTVCSCSRTHATGAVIASTFGVIAEVIAEVLDQGELDEPSRHKLAAVYRALSSASALVEEATNE